MIGWATGWVVDCRIGDKGFESVRRDSVFNIFYKDFYIVQSMTSLQITPNFLIWCSRKYYTITTSTALHQSISICRSSLISNAIWGFHMKSRDALYLLYAKRGAGGDTSNSKHVRWTLKSFFVMRPGRW